MMGDELVVWVLWSKLCVMTAALVLLENLTNIDMQIVF